MRPEQNFARNARLARLGLMSIPMSQRDLARRCGVHQTVISKIERGERGIRLDEAVAIADALRTTVEALIGDEAP